MQRGSGGVRRSGAVDVPQNACVRMSTVAPTPWLSSLVVGPRVTNSVGNGWACADVANSKMTASRVFPQLQYLLIVRFIAQRLLERGAAPFFQCGRTEQTVRVRHGRRIESKAVAVDPERHRREEGIDRRGCLAGEKQSAETARTKLQ